MSITATTVIDSVKAVFARYPAIATALVVYLSLRMWPSKPRRSGKLPPADERVVIIGASSGIGRALAHRYAKAGVRLCIVARREQELAKVAEECKELFPKGSASKVDDLVNHLLLAKADFTVVDEMVALRNKVKEAWGGLDTLAVCAGVATLKPFFEVAGIKVNGDTFTPLEADKQAIERIVDVANVTVRADYTGPVVAAATFIPLLAASSVAPAIMLMSTLASVIPAPTLSLYGAAKSAAYQLYQALAIEHPSISFTLVLPSTVRGDAFFHAAADGGTIRPGAADPNMYGLTHEAVAERSFDAVARGEKTVLIPGRAHIAHILFWVAPSIVNKVARKRYNYPPVV
ncbi:NAD(P)-binding protein [Trametes meyenii]|nr:NAD(P)-binding protein [Trametes meyenii]